MAVKNDESYYIINFRDPKDAKVTSLKARTIADSRLGLSFISVSDFVFTESALVADPTEEANKKRYASTKSLHLSIYSVLSIEEMGKANKGLKFKKSKSNVFLLASQSPVP
ncbi:MAG: DUF1820 family protein [Bdellovibrionia bacterium]